ncbi:chitinase-like protein EN03 [Nilaparvata lugens]|uniref:Seminal fluid protein n=1 Tax=Nilaparvata lugens TaxID=108931 RepID=A0A1I9WL32_NILLU|nr:chitinase-like protein EN03 [Nilaparvata lugens]APA33852.1 seminal fluid protein [Nilaparvata lugens]
MRFSLLSVICLIGLHTAYSARVVCYWDGRSFHREGVAKITVEEIKPALTYCTHLIYGFAAIDDDDYHIEPIDKKLDTDKDNGHNQYKQVTDLKRSHPGLTVLLSVGGNADTEDPEKYLTLLESKDHQTKFINSVKTFLTKHGFDGIDIAWQFPVVKEKKDRGIIGGFFHKVKKTFGSGVDDKAEEHKDQFVTLLRDMKSVLRTDNKIMTLGVLPHVNSTVYYDVKDILPYLEFINLWTVDFRTPKRTSDQADYAAPLYYQYDRKPHQNIDSTVRWWKEQGAEPHKLIVGLPTYGRTWKTTLDSAISGVPPLVADGPGPAGTHTKTEGLLAYYEICPRIVSPTNAKAPRDTLRRVTDPSKRLGTYGYHMPNKQKNEEEGIWVSFEEPETAAQKAQYVKQNGYGGVALIELSLDDPRGMCDGTKYPILKQAKVSL